jgi:N-acetyl-anhydromuramyl-L-alanine amidase AmpD
MKFDDIVKTKSKSPWVNKKRFIILHHTGGGTYEGNLKVLSTSWKVSCHHVVWENKVAKIWEYDDIVWHAWLSKWWDLSNLNSHSICIEIIDKNKTFNDRQRDTVKQLVYDIAKKYDIPYQNILRHSDVAPGRKIDPYATLWNTRYKTYKEYQKSLIMDCSYKDEIMLNNLINKFQTEWYLTNSDSVKDHLHELANITRSFLSVK